MPDAASGRFEADVGCCNARACLVRSKKSVLVVHHDSAPTRHAAPSPSAVSTCSGRGQRSPPPPSRRHRAQSASHVRKSRRFRRATRVQPSMWSFPRRPFRTACAGSGIQGTSANLPFQRVGQDRLWIRHDLSGRLGLRLCHPLKSEEQQGRRQPTSQRSDGVPEGPAWQISAGPVVSR